MVTQNYQQENLNTGVARLEERLKQVSEDIREIKQSVGLVARHDMLLYGNGLQIGLVEQIQNVEKCVLSLDEWRKKIIAIVSVVAFIGSAAGIMIKDVMVALIVK